MGLLRWGYLTKRGGAKGGRKSWKKRWFVLAAGAGDEGHTLSYYKNEKDMKTPLGVIQINGNVRTKRVSMERFELDSETRTYFLIAQDEEDCVEWINILDYLIDSQASTSTGLEDAIMLKQSGYLHTEVGIRKQWKSQYYVLDSRRLCFYKDDTLTSPLGAINLVDVSEVGALTDECFAVVANEKIRYFCAETPEQVDDWVAVLQNAVDYVRMKAGLQSNAPPKPRNTTLLRRAAAGGATDSSGDAPPVPVRGGAPPVPVRGGAPPPVPVRGSSSAALNVQIPVQEPLEEFHWSPPPSPDSPDAIEEFPEPPFITVGEGDGNSGEGFEELPSSPLTTERILQRLSLADAILPTQPPPFRSTFSSKRPLPSPRTEMAPNDTDRKSVV